MLKWRSGVCWITEIRLNQAVGENGWTDEDAAVAGLDGGWHYFPTGFKHIL